MNKMKWFLASIVVTFAGAGVAGLPGVGFFAPAVDGKDTIHEPEVGAIVYDSSDSSFYGRTHSGTWVLFEDGETGDVAFLKDVKSSNVSGGSSLANTWEQRDLNTHEGNTSFVSLSSNQFTLQPGKYKIHASAPAYKTVRSVARLYDVTNSASLFMGTSEYASNTSNVQVRSHVQGVVEISTATTYEIQHLTEQAVSGDGHGVAHGQGDNVYTTVEITKLD